MNTYFGTNAVGWARALGEAISEDANSRFRRALQVPRPRPLAPC